MQEQKEEEPKQEPGEEEEPQQAAATPVPRSSGGGSFSRLDSPLCSPGSGGEVGAEALRQVFQAYASFGERNAGERVGNHERGVGRGWGRGRPGLVGVIPAQQAC